MPSALRARAKPFAALTFMDVFLPATSYRDEPVLSRTTRGKLAALRRTSAQRGEETAHEGSAPDDDPAPHADPAGEFRPGARGGTGALGRARGALRRARGADDVGGARLALSRVVRPCRTHGDHHPHDGALRGARRDGEADAGQPDGPVAGRILDGIQGRAELRVRPA